MASAKQGKLILIAGCCVERVIIGKGQAQGAVAGQLLGDKER